MRIRSAVLGPRGSRSLVAASSAAAVCVAAAAALALASPARAHGVDDEQAAHAEAHAKAEVLDRARRAAWARLTASQRRERVDRIARQTRRLNARITGERDDIGYWDPKLRPLPEYAINAVVLPTGKILIWGREPYVGGARSNLGSARLFDPLTGATKHVPPPPIAANPDSQGRPMPAPIFCAGQTFLSDGRVLLAGGNLSDPRPGRPYNSGLDYTFIFNPWNEANPWQTGPRMTRGRWYPTLTRLTSGDVLIAGGLDETGRAGSGGASRRNVYMDIWRPGENTPQPLAMLDPYPAGTRADPQEFDEPGATLTPGGAFGLSQYPHMYVLPDGNVGLAGPGRQDSAILDTGPGLYDRDADHGSAWTQTPDWPDNAPSVDHQGGTTAIEPDLSLLASTWNLLAMAGADPSADGAVRLARKNVDRLDADPAALAWTHDPTADLNRARMYANTVLLPDGGTVVVGGGVGSDYRTEDSKGMYYVGEPAPGGGQSLPDPPIDNKRTELRNPGERTWRLGAAQQEWRTYHSTAALIPDGRIVSAGDDGSPKLTTSRDDAEIYWPPYLFDGDSCALRPVIRGVGKNGPPFTGARAWAILGYGETFGIYSEHAREGMRAVLVAPAATTHSVDMNQRVVLLGVGGTVARGGVNVTMPSSAASAPPGYYMLFVIDPDGTPSAARWVRVLPPLQAAAARGGVALQTVGTVWADPKGRRCVNPDGTVRAEPDPPRPPAPPPPAAPGSGSDAATVKLASKLSIMRAAIRRAANKLDLVAPISAHASGRVKLVLQSAGRRTRMTAAIDSERRRIRVNRTIPAAQARLGTGIVTLTYGGNDETFPQSVRLRAAKRHARLHVQRPTISAGGRLRASGTISTRARGAVRLQLQFGTAQTTHTLRFRAKIRDGRWALNVLLPKASRDGLAARTGTVHSYTLFTGYEPAQIRGEMRSYEVLGEPRPGRPRVGRAYGASRKTTHRPPGASHRSASRRARSGSR